MLDDSKSKDEASKPATTKSSPSASPKPDLTRMPLADLMNRSAEAIAANLRQQTAEPVQKPTSKDDLLTMPLKDFADRAAGDIAANLRRKTAEPEKPDDDPTP